LDKLRFNRKKRRFTYCSASGLRYCLAMKTNTNEIKRAAYLVSHTGLWRGQIQTRCHTTPDRAAAFNYLKKWQDKGHACAVVEVCAECGFETCCCNAF